MKQTTAIVAACLPLILCSGSRGAPQPLLPVDQGMDHAEFFEWLAGNWEGTCRTWLRPGQLSDESTVTGEFQPLLQGQFVRHSYAGTVMGKPRSGETTITFHGVEKKLQVFWFDNFHMNDAVMRSEGAMTETGFSVHGEFSMQPGQVPWGWRTVYEMIDEEHLTITAYIITPDGEEGKAVETTYQRVEPASD